MRVVLILLVVLTSCSPRRTICKAPTKKQIKKAMKHSDWRYVNY